MEESRLSKKSLFACVSRIIESARGTIARTINSEMVSAYWLIGKEIVDEEQKGRRNFIFADTSADNESAFYVCCTCEFVMRGQFYLHIGDQIC